MDKKLIEAEQSGYKIEQIMFGVEKYSTIEIESSSSEKTYQIIFSFLIVFFF